MCIRLQDTLPSASVILTCCINRLHDRCSCFVQRSVVTVLEMSDNRITEWFGLQENLKIIQFQLPCYVISMILPQRLTEPSKVDQALGSSQFVLFHKSLTLQNRSTCSHYSCLFLLFKSQCNTQFPEVTKIMSMIPQILTDNTPRTLMSNSDN